MSLNERGRFGRIGLTGEGDRRGKDLVKSPSDSQGDGLPPIRSPKNVSKIMGALQQANGHGQASHGAL